MGKFKVPLDLREIGQIDGVQYWELLEDFFYELGAEGSGYVIHVPKGTKTDFASIPWYLWWIFPPFGKYNKPAVIHDYLYKKGSGFSKVVADAIFYEAMESSGVPFCQRWMMWKAVSYFGQSSFQWEMQTGMFSTDQKSPPA